MELIGDYLQRLTEIVGPFLTCGPVLHWFEMDNKGNRLISEVCLQHGFFCLIFTTKIFLTFFYHHFHFSYGTLTRQQLEQHL